MAKHRCRGQLHIFQEGRTGPSVGDGVCFLHGDNERDLIRLATRKLKREFPGRCGALYCDGPGIGHQNWKQADGDPPLLWVGRLGAENTGAKGLDTATNLE